MHGRDGAGIMIRGIASEDEPCTIGSVINADIVNDTIRVKLKIHVEDARIGVPYIVHGEKFDFYCISSNVIHDFSPMVMKLANTGDFTAPIEHTREAAGSLEPVPFPAIMDLSCLKVVSRGPGPTISSGFNIIPKIFSEVRVAMQRDIERLVEGMIRPGDTSGSIGHFLGTTYEFPLNLTELFRVPFGIFGKTGFGKTVTAKTILIRALSQGCYVDGRPVQFIVFDAQGEYARGIGSSTNLGLFQYVPDKLHQLSIDPGSTTTANTTPLYIDPGELTVTDWLNAFWDYTGNMEALLKEMETERRKEIQSKGPSPETADLARYVQEFPESFKAFPQYTVNAVWRRMQRFNEPAFRRFLTVPPQGHDHVMRKAFQLLGSGKSIIIHFGRHGLTTNVYMFVTNYITRKLYEKYSMSVDDVDTRLPQLVLMVEEAHRFIPSVREGGMSYSGSSYFHKIARETRKFGLTAGFMDQRPSKLDDEVVSQLASRVIHRLDDPDDVKSALAGLSKIKWTPIVSKLAKGETTWFGNAVGDIPTMIKPYWSTVIDDVKRFFNITAVTSDMLRRAFESQLAGKVDDGDDNGTMDTSPSLENGSIPTVQARGAIPSPEKGVATIDRAPALPFAPRKKINIDFCDEDFEIDQGDDDDDDDTS